ncbi:rhodanese-like domain-containing protein [Microvirga pudoricolor]|uniref:rhodanese-like domain-containing protein n=1 Tax=Microvirga pudoricolor TaxID=2778729 RepID=UPI001950ADF7|nr:rhodanese-like domain-containing protein [Microvirga pudoricolor]MBM6594499.1 rhodanese-like domain-containing protein [Microvirga pudoricolor]
MNAFQGPIDLTRDDVKRGMADQSFLLVDVREPHEFAMGHIPGAVSHPLSTFDPASLPEGRRIVFSCAAGVRSVRAMELAQAAGRDVREHYKGGFKDWAAAGEPVQR